MADSHEPTVLIIGAGVFGTSTAYHLAQRYTDPSRITVVDRDASPPPPAASTDINKIIRADYSSPFYASLAYEALAAWADWPELAPFYHRTGWIMLAADDTDLDARIRAVMRDRGHDPTSDVPLEEIEARWNGALRGTCMDGIRGAYWNPEAGWCEAADATASLMQAARRKGVRYVEAAVEGLELASSSDGGVAGARTAAGELLTADQIVMATGAWTSSLLGEVEHRLSIGGEDGVERQAQAAGVSVAHYRLSEAELQSLAEMPVVVYGERGEVIPPPQLSRLLKFTCVSGFTNMVEDRWGRRFSVPPDRDQHLVPDSMKEEMRRAMTSQVMPAFTRDKEVDYWRLCWDARTPTQDWLLSRHPHQRLSNLFFAIGGSFHGYKFLPNIGKYMANVLSGESNGSAADKAWGWKAPGVSWRGAHEKTAPKWDLSDIENGST